MAVSSIAFVANVPWVVPYFASVSDFKIYRGIREVCIQNNEQKKVYIVSWAAKGLLPGS